MRTHKQVYGRWDQPIPLCDTWPYDGPELTRDATEVSCKRCLRVMNLDKSGFLWYT